MQRGPWRERKACRMSADLSRQVVDKMSALVASQLRHDSLGPALQLGLAEPKPAGRRLVGGDGFEPPTLSV
jgi:hypothetical protein